MDMKISGSGVIGAGEYEDIKISGSAKVRGPIRCKSFSASGAVGGNESIECAESFRVSGSGSFDGSIKAGCVGVAGAFSCKGSVSASGKAAKCSDNAKLLGNIKECLGTLKDGDISIAGAANIDGDVEAEIVKIDGKLDCSGLINAEEIDIAFDSGMDIGSIGGSRISIYRSHSRSRRISRLPLISSLLSSVGAGKVDVKTAIEGDVIAIENVRVPRVSGRIVAVGEDCEIDLVQYTEQIEVSPNAKVGKIEKV